MSSRKQFKEVLPQYGNVPRRERVPLPSLGLRVSERKLLLLLIDVALINGSLILALLLFTDLSSSLWASIALGKWYITLTAIWIVLAVIFDAYDLVQASSSSKALRTVVPAAGLASLIYTGTPWLTPTIQNRSQVFAFVAFAILSLSCWRCLYATLFVQSPFQQRALVVGAGRSGRALARALHSLSARRNTDAFRGTGYQLLGFVDDNQALHASDVEGIPVLGSSKQLVSLACCMHVDEVIVAITDPQRIRPELFEALVACRERGLSISTMPTVYQRLTGRVAVEQASHNLELAAGNKDSAFYRLYLLCKRMVDLGCTLIGLVLLGFTIPVVAGANAFFSPGSLFFRQERVGCAGHPFILIKFRSMVPDAETGGRAQWAARDDRRVTHVGRWLRKSHVDELPQVINVLRGEMSIVGPRPERPEFVADLANIIPFYRARHAVRPGITGWAQIHQDYGDSVDRVREKLEYDLYYVRNASGLLDTLIVLRTISKVVGFRGR